MMSKSFQKTMIVDKWGGIYDSEIDKILDVNDVEHKLNEQQATIKHLEEYCGDLEADVKRLMKENEHLRKELNDCEKFRYQVFKRIGELSR